jgi:CheY-like chemotaxis protein
MQIRILIIEDDEEWRDTLQQTLAQIAPHQQCDMKTAATFEEGVRAIRSQTYDLVTVDLNMPDAPTNAKEDQQAIALELADILRQSSSENVDCGLLIVTAYPTFDRLRQAVFNYRVDDFIDKHEFTQAACLHTARAALRRSFFRRADGRVKQRSTLDVYCSATSVTGYVLSGPEHHATKTVGSPQSFDAEGFVRRADELNTLHESGARVAWREETRAIGTELYQALTRDQDFLVQIGQARAVTQRRDNLQIRIRTPPEGLGLPFELLHDGGDYYCLAHQVVRRVDQIGNDVRRHTQTFCAFLDELAKNNDTLRILVIGANSDGKIPLTEQEADHVATILPQMLTTLGISHDVVCLTGEQADYQTIQQTLATQSFHMLHYAGHGIFNDETPEVSGIVLRNGNRLVTLRAHDLTLLLCDKGFQFAFLSCCLGARTAQHIGYGDFYGTLEAIVRTDVPTVLGYRWTVGDHQARELAIAFYTQLFSTFAPGSSLLRARQMLASNPGAGRNDSTWLAPVLVEQN